MKKQHNELIKILAEDKEWQTAKTLAMKLNVSERSVKNYIAEINSCCMIPSNPPNAATACRWKISRHLCGRMRQPSRRVRGRDRSISWNGSLPVRSVRRKSIFLMSVKSCVSA